ncbi:MAG: hypothetical protein E6K53_00085 [Gammaproteobacteria bacterium]|nr:MAG: hypothetical protein E6K53_00085 [Gammaproteobacteria bacterium]
MTGPRTQPAIIDALQHIAEAHGYRVTTRKKDGAKAPGDKKFLPDVVATPYKGNGKRVFEVEVTITNNTVYKSIFSLLTALKNGAAEGYLVVPKKKDVAFAEGCMANVRAVIKHFSKSALGANKKIKLVVLAVSDVGTHAAKAKKYVAGGCVGQPPKCPFLPRVR